jgi:hypothetical protein
LPEIPPVLPFLKGGELLGIRWRIPSTFSPFGKREAVKKFKSREGKASIVARGRGKLTPPKPGGR